MRRFNLFVLLPVTVLLLAAGNTAVAQKTIGGTVTDAETGETLPAANIRIEDSYRGTITNEEGAYRLTIPDSLLPAVIEVRFLGYESARRTIVSSSAQVQHFRLRPSVYEMEAITVTDENPAERIMREVIRRKKEWREGLLTYRAEAYNRQTLSNDTAIVQVSETISTAFWHRDRGHREVVRSRRQTANIEAGQNFAGVSYLPNLYDDNIDLAGFNVVGVTHPDAPDYYNFKLIDRHLIDNRTVYEIQVIPSRKLQPLFRGTVYVLDEEYALLEMDLAPNDVVKFPAPVKSFDSSYRQQYNNFDGDYWLPVDMRIDGEIKVKMMGLEFPMIRFRQVSQVSDYTINGPLPDTLYEKKRLISADTAAAASDSLFEQTAGKVPLSVEEEKAYSELDSTYTLEKAFRPTGFLARFIDDEDEDDQRGGGGIFSRLDIPGELHPRLRYNRVDALHAGLKYEIQPLNGWSFHGLGGYNTGYEEWSYGFGSMYRLSAGVFRLGIGADYREDTSPRYDSRIFRPEHSSVPNLLGEENYFDYYHKKGWRFIMDIAYRPLDLSAKTGFTVERHRSLTVNTAYDLAASSRTPRFNPPVDEGRLNSIDVEWGYNLDEPHSMGALPYKKLFFRIEHSTPALGSDFRFTSYQTRLNWSFATFYRRRFLPNALDLQLSAGTYQGELPLQKMDVIDGSLGIFSPFGVLRGLRGRPYEGEQYISLLAEHNFRSIPFEALGIRPPADWNLGVIVYGGAGKTRISADRRDFLQNTYDGYRLNSTEGVHYEAGASLNGIFNLFRLDFTTRLDRPGFFIGVGVARFL